MGAGEWIALVTLGVVILGGLIHNSIRLGRIALTCETFEDHKTEVWAKFDRVDGRLTIHGEEIATLKGRQCR